MVKYDFDNAEEFSRLEHLAYDGQLDFNEFPAAEYRYFDRIQNIGYRVRHEKLPMEFALKDRNKALEDYKNDIARAKHCLKVYGEYNKSRIRMSGLVNLIYKEHSPLEKLRLALEFVELSVGEEGLARRNMSENYLEQSVSE